MAASSVPPTGSPAYLRWRSVTAARAARLLMLEIGSLQQPALRERVYHPSDPSHTHPSAFHLLYVLRRPRTQSRWPPQQRMASPRSRWLSTRSSLMPSMRTAAAPSKCVEAAFAGRLRLAWGMGDGWPPPSLEIFAWRRQVNPMQRTRCTPFRLPCRPAS
jgi:hypothetical protein